MKQKRLAAFIVTGMLCLLALPLRTPVSAATASASLSGPGTVRAGDTIDITLSISGNGILGVKSTISYDASILSFKGFTSKHGSWSVMYNKDTKIFSADGSSPINGSQALITFKFAVSSSVAVGDTIKVSTQGLQVSDGTMMTANNASYSKTVAAPASAENRLSALSVSNATLSPAFDENKISYSAGTVPFSTAKLNVSATPKDSKAKVSISGTTLAVGANTVKITVTAESGAVKAYTISVTREQDPNYVGDSNNQIANITVDGFKISPPFNKDITSYVVWLPYETTVITVTATPESSKASVKIEGGGDLQEGDNPIRIICTPEDGAAKTYLLIAKRAAQQNGDAGQIAPQEKRDPGTGIRLIDINYMLEGDEVFSVMSINDGDQYGFSDIADRFQVFDITLLKEDEEGQADTAVRIQIPLPEGYDSAKCRVYRIEDDGTKTDMNAEYFIDSATQEKFMVFVAKDFGLYALIQLKDKTTGTQWNDMIYYIAMPALFIGGGGIGSGIGIAAYKGLANRKPRSSAKFNTKSMPKIPTRTNTKSKTKFSMKPGKKRRMF